MKRLTSAAVLAFGVASALTFALTAAGCSQRPKPPSEDRWLLTGTKLYVAPDIPPLENAWVVIADGKIQDVGDADVAKPTNIRTHDECSGGVITAGFQNSHVHLLHPALSDPATQPAAELENFMTAMLTRFGFTTVVDTGSDIALTTALRQRIENADVKGPAILTAGIPVYPHDGLPIYLRHLSPQILQMLAQPATPEAAVEHLRKNFARGADAVKLFVATPQGGGEIKRMPPDIMTAAVVEAHKRGRPAMAHPTDPQGIADAVAAGVDILVHTTIDSPEPVWSAELIGRMVANNVAVVPTLKLWRYELDKAQAPENVRAELMAASQQQLKSFSDAGGQVLFGTDVGYMTDFDPTDEYVLMAAAGLTPMQILASLTTAPAERWSASARRGGVRAGLDADLVVLNGDPAADVRHFSDVKCTIRGGREIFVNASSN